MREPNSAKFKTSNGRQQSFKQDHNLKSEVLNSQELMAIWTKRAQVLAMEPPAETSGQTLDLLVFSVNGEQYGIEVSNVREIYPLEQLTPVPRTPNFVRGVFSARGRILSVVDLRAFFGLSPAELSDQIKIIVAINTDLNSETAHMELGIVTDDVADVLTIFRDELEPPLSSHTGGRNEYIRGITAEMLVVLDFNRILNDKRLLVYEELI